MTPAKIPEVDLTLTARDFEPIAMPEFIKFGKMARYSRECIITEKIDGTNAQIFIPSADSDEIFVGSRNRWISPIESDDNYGFAAWVEENKTDLLKLGPGRHYGEWWGRGINRAYGMTERRFSLFNARRWCPFGGEPEIISQPNPNAPVKYQDIVPQCCHVVPIIGVGPFGDTMVAHALESLSKNGSYAAPDRFEDPEGIVIYHVQGNAMFKKTLKNDELPKGATMR